jgi:hypothetical protein
MLGIGIYSIASPSGNQYIGSSIDIHRRKLQHFSQLKRGVHLNPFLQMAYDKYGDLKFSTILICRESDLIFYEQLLIDAFRPKYNIILSAIATPPAGWKHTDQAKAKMRGRIRTPEHRTALSIAHIGKKSRLGIKGPGGKPVLCIETGEVFASMGMAFDWLKSIGKTTAKDRCKGYAGISLAVNGIRKRANGFTWALASEVPLFHRGAMRVKQSVDHEVKTS